MRLRGPIFALLIATVAIAAPPGAWLRVTSPHFMVVSDGTAAQARRVAGQMERMRAVFQTLFPEITLDERPPATIVALKTRKEFNALLPASFQGHNQVDLAGFFMPGSDADATTDTTLLRLDTGLDPGGPQAHPYAILYHEYTHTLLRGAVRMPLWLDEGLAQFYQNTDITGDEAVVGQADADALAQLRAVEHPLPLATLFAADTQSPYYHDHDRANLFYAESWALTHYLITDDRRFGGHRIADYLAASARNPDPVAAARQAFGDLGPLQSALDEYMRQRVFTAFVLHLGPGADPAGFAATPLAPAAAEAVWAGVQLRNGRDAEARARLLAAVRVDPHDPATLLALGRLELRAHQGAPAVEWLRQATVAAPADGRARYLLAQAELAAGDAPGAEAALRQALPLAPDFAPADNALAQLLIAQHRNPDEAAALLRRAALLSPRSDPYRGNTANQLASMNQVDDAVAVLLDTRPGAPTPGQPDGVATRTRDLQQIVAQAAAAPHAPLLASATPPAATQTAEGRILRVTCTAPGTLELTLEVGSFPLLLRTADYHQVAFTPLNFTPPAPLQPCADATGLAARVSYQVAGAPDAPPTLLAVFLIQ